ncbi:1-phosphatidylinositol 45-bisphosphate phosphodiesterase delta-4 [Dissostichus eleginoides]|uniref:Phosphoinositide phospholipase C n=1 Tax=Dissostichus eleginoides TaxID=100907 RepID=A0AAD9EWT6_DISEL|nr:1-phosphatidylinositol 45-bisphosphate phosphodiesterase delta-4 [Dissostichus eleginoides]
MEEKSEESFPVRVFSLQEELRAEEEHMETHEELQEEVSRAAGQCEQTEGGAGAHAAPHHWTGGAAAHCAGRTSVFQFTVSEEMDCCQVGGQSFLVTLGKLSLLLQFKTPTDMKNFQQLLRTGDDEGTRKGCPEVEKRGNQDEGPTPRHPMMLETRTEDAPTQDYQQVLLQDYPRTTTYQKAILLNESDFRGKVVLDVSCGSAMLSFFALQAGATKVYAVESSPMAKYAKILVQSNSLSDRIEILEGKVEEVSCPELVDVLVSEPMGYMLLSDRLVESFLHAKKWLKPNGLMFPSSGDIHLAPFSDEQLYFEHYARATFWQQRSFYGVNLSALHSAAMDEFFRQPIVDTFDMPVLMAKSVKHCINFMEAKAEDLNRIEIPFVFTLLQSGLIHGLAFWFDVAYVGSNSHGASDPLVSGQMFAADTALHQAGQTLSGTVLLVANNRQSYDIHISATVDQSGFTSGNVLDLKNPYFSDVVEPPQTASLLRVQSEENTGIQGDDNLQSMLVGTIMRKIKSRTWKKQRYFKLQDDFMTIWYKSKKAGNTHSTFSVSDLEAIREGHQSEVLLSIADEFPADRCFTLVFRGRRGNLDLVAESSEEAQSWVRGMRKLIENLENMGEREKLDQWIGDWFKKADKNNDGRMNFKEVRDLLKMMNVDMNEQHAHRLFTTADKSQTGTLEDDEFVLFYKMLTQRDDVLRVFQEFSFDGQKLSKRDLEDFLRNEQLEGGDIQLHAKQLIERYEPSDTAKLLNAMTFDGFLMYLGSVEGSIFNQQWLGIFQDMNQPLCHYFISSSHNTYLMEDQLRGQSSVEGYIRALSRGCRCVEVDCWDGANGEPIVYHGHTFTSKILFKDVVTAVGNYAFKASEYPVILSIENHCGVEQQRVMAQHLNHILGDKLLKSTLDGKAPSRLPSPEDLKGKILLKAKKIGGLEESFNEMAEDSQTGELSDEDEVADIEEENQHRESVRRRVMKSKQRLSKELSDCVVYCKSVHFSNFKHSRIHSKFYEVASFTESKARKQLREAGADFVHHNSQQLTRIYPSGFRTDSSNFNPQEMWNVGCQIVALNFQTAGEGMDLNDGLFRQNNSCGYVLKPRFMREAEKFDPETPHEREGYQPVVLTIQVISGQQLPKVNIKEGSIVDPLVRVEINGVPMDQAKQETRYIDNNGFNPVWYDTLRFTIHTPELAMVRFVVEDYDKTSRNDFVGQYTLPLICMQQGYRHIHLLSRDGTSIPPSSLFVHIRITELE